MQTFCSKMNLPARRLLPALGLGCVVLAVCCGGNGDSDDNPHGSDPPASEDQGEPVQGTNVWQPQPGTSWQWQLTGLPVDTRFDVVMYDIDLFDGSAEVIAGLHTQDRVVICYFSAGSYEAWRPDASRFPAGALGEPLDDWDDECWLDIRNAEVRAIMVDRLDLAVSKGCDGVEPDNVDGYSNESGFELSGSDQLDYNRFLANEAHTRNLSVGLKNDLDQIDSLLPYFDWALNEECFTFEECELLLPFVRAQKAVFQVEYGGPDLVERICPQANRFDFDTLIKNLDLDSWRISCR